MTQEQIKEFQDLRFAIEKYYEGHPFGDFCDEDTLINICDALLSLLDYSVPNWEEDYEFEE